jgi:hypothetical protein
MLLFLFHHPLKEQTFLKQEPMNAIHHPLRASREISSVQLIGKLTLLAGVLMAYSYCFILTANSIIKLFR